MSFLQRFLPFVAVFMMLFWTQVGLAQTVAGTEGNNKAGVSENMVVVNINTATIEELQTLKGIGPSKAQAIVTYRTEQGKFNSTEDLMNVKGFSEKIVKKLLEQNPNQVVAQ